MELWRAATQAAILRREESAHERYKFIEEFVQSHDDWIEAVVLWFDDEPRIGTSWFTSRVPTYFGVHAEEWIGLTKTHPIVPLLASESSDNLESNWTVDDVYIVLSSMDNRNLGDIVETLSEDEAYIFWQVALGEPPPISRRQMLRAIAQFTNYTTTELRRAVAYTPFLEVVEKAVSAVLPTSTDMEVGHHIHPPARYEYWGKVSLPFNPTFIDILDSPRLFLHYTGSDALLYTRAGELVQSWETEHSPSIFEIECADDYDPATIIYTDILVHEGNNVWNQTYSQRNTLLTETYKANSTRPVRQISTVAELREVLRAVKPEQTVRLIDDVPYYDDDFIGGYILRQQALKMPLLITHVRGEESVDIRLAAMDGHTPVYVGETVCPQDIANYLRTHPHFGRYMSDRWTHMDDAGCIIWVSAVGINAHEGNYHLDSPTLIGIDTTLGVSDTMQLSDILSIVDV